MAAEPFTTRPSRFRAARAVFALLVVLAATLACVLTPKGSPSIAAFAPTPSASESDEAEPAGVASAASASAAPSVSTKSSAVASASVSGSASASAPVIASAKPSASAHGPEVKASHSAGSETSQRGIVKMVAGLALVVILAILAGHPKVRAFERQLGLTLAVASGLPFMVLGVIFQHPSVNVIDASTLKEFGPFIEFGLGWVGFVIGMEFDVRKLDELDDGVGTFVVIESLTPFVATASLATGVLFALGALGGATLTDDVTIRNGLLIGACATVSSATIPIAIARGASKTAARVMERIAQLDDAAALVVLLVVSTWFRPIQSTSWQLPTIAWLFVTVGLGTVLGVLTYALLRGARDGKEELAFTIGAIAFAAGVSGRLGLSPLVVCAASGALFANLPRRRGSQLVSTMQMVERPLVLLFMLFAGATAPFGAWQGWLLLPVFLVARGAGKWLGIRLARRVGPEELKKTPGITLALMPQSPTAIAAMLAAANLYGASSKDPLGWMFTAILVGTYLNDVAVQIFAQRVTHVGASAIDEAANSMRPPPPALASLHRAISADEAVIEMSGETDAPVPEIRVPPPPPLPKVDEMP